MHTAWSANLTWSASASAVEYTATDASPISRQARITRSAISPRLAISTFLNMAAPGWSPHGAPRRRRALSYLRVHRRASGGDLEQRLTVLDRRAVLDEDRLDRAGDVGL